MQLSGPGFSAELNKSRMFKGVPERLNSTLPWSAALTPSLGGGYVWRRTSIHIPHLDDEPFHGFLLLEAEFGVVRICVCSVGSYVLSRHGVPFGKQKQPSSNLAHDRA